LLNWFIKTGEATFLLTEHEYIVTNEIISMMKYVFMIKIFENEIMFFGRRSTAHGS